MNKTNFIKLFIFILVASIFPKTYSAEYIIFSVAQDVPMGEPGEVVKKNYYVNIGSKQGVEKGTVLEVMREISRQDPYESKKRFNFDVEIGQLKVIHTEENSAIAILQQINTGKESPLYEIDNFMVGDRVQVDVD